MLSCSDQVIKGIGMIVIFLTINFKVEADLSTTTSHDITHIPAVTASNSTIHGNGSSSRGISNQSQIAFASGLQQSVLSFYPSNVQTTTTGILSSTQQYNSQLTVPSTHRNVQAVAKELLIKSSNHQNNEKNYFRLNGSNGTSPNDGLEVDGYSNGSRDVAVSGNVSALISAVIDPVIEMYDVTGDIDDNGTDDIDNNDDSNTDAEVSNAYRQSTYYDSDNNVQPTSDDSQILDVAIDGKQLRDYHVGAEYHSYELHLSKQLAELGIHDLKGRAISLRWLEEHNKSGLHVFSPRSLLWLTISLLLLSAIAISALFKHRHLGTKLVQYARSQYTSSRRADRWRPVNANDESNTLLANAQV
jgi:hypothetical protein